MNPPASPSGRPNRRLVRMRYERAAIRYGSAAHIEAEMGARLMERTEFMNLGPESVLDGGCGSGTAFAALAARFPRARVVGVDFARGMLAEARRLSSGANLVAADMEQLPFADGSFGVCWLNACLHLVPDRAKALREARRVLEDEGLLLFSTFGPDTLREVRAAFGGIDSCAHAGSFADMHSLGDELRLHGMADPVMEAEELVVLYSRPEDLVGELRLSGAANVAEGARKSLVGRNDWKRFLDNYRKLAPRDDGKVAATFEIVLGHAWCKKGLPREDSPGISPIGFYRRN